MRYLYQILIYLALPWLLARLWWLGRQQPAYRERLLERLGFYPFQLKKCLWLHAVSVGEVLVAAPIIKLLQEYYPHIPLVVTTTTPTGAARVQALFGPAVQHVYLPYDTYHASYAFLQALNPLIGIFIETELWPNLLALGHRRNIPLFLINARLSEKSAHHYRWGGSVTKQMLDNLTMIAAQYPQDAQRFQALGAELQKIVVTGNNKFDLTISPHILSNSRALRAQLGAHHYIWIAASTHPGEEEGILMAHCLLQAHRPEIILLLVPRHPHRSSELLKQCQHHQLSACYWSQRYTQSSPSPPNVYIGDTFGELLLLYSLADMVFVGGSWIPQGGHNLIEPAALAKPILTGPHLFNFATISTFLLEAQAMTIVETPEALAACLSEYLLNPAKYHRMGHQAQQVVHQHRGATQKQWQIIQQSLAAHSVVGASTLLSN